MAVKIIVDSTADFSAEKIKEMNVDCAPLRVLFGEDALLDGVEITNEQFYTRLANSAELPSTSQVTPIEFEGLFSRYTSEGHDVIGIFISSKLSGTYQSAEMAKNIVNSDKVHIIDSASVTAGAGLLVLEAVKMRDGGAAATEIVEKLNTMIPKIRIVAAPTTLKYLKKGGRLSSTAAFVAEVLNITPIISISDGVVSSVGKVRGTKAVHNFFADYLNEHGVNTDYPIGVIHSQTRESADKVCELLKQKGHSDNFFIGDIGAVVGTHIGPGAYGVAFVAK